MTKLIKIKRNSSGGIKLISGGWEYVEGRRSPYNSPLFEMTRLNLADFNQANAATYIDGSVSDLGPGSGWRVPLLGGITGGNYPLDSWHAISKVPITDLFGRQYDPARDWTMWVGFKEIAAESAANIDAHIYVGLCSESADSGTIGGSANGVAYSGSAGSRVARSVYFSNGANVGFVTGTSNSSIRAWRGGYEKVGTSGALLGKPSFCWTSSTDLGLNVGGGSPSLVSWGNVKVPYLFIACYRTSTTDTTTRTFDFESYYLPGFNIIQP